MSYSNNSFFEMYSESLIEVTKERRKKEREATTVNVKSYLYTLEQETANLLFLIINQIAEENEKIEKLTEAGIIALIKYYCSYPNMLKKLRIIDEKIIVEFPKDERSLKFIQAYLEKDISKIIDLKKEIEL